VGAAEVELHLPQHLLPPGAGVFRSSAVAHLIPAHDEGMAGLVPSLDYFKGPHEAMKTSVGFEVSGHIVMTGSPALRIVPPGVVNVASGSGPRLSVSNAFMDHFDFVSVGLRMAVLLPKGGGYACIADLEVKGM